MPKNTRLPRHVWRWIACVLLLAGGVGLLWREPPADRTQAGQVTATTNDGGQAQSQTTPPTAPQTTPQRGQSAPIAWPDSNVALEAVRAAIDRAANHLTQGCSPAGRFRYLAQNGVPLSDAQERGTYNLLRHCLAVDALVRYDRQFGPRDDVRQAAVRGARFLREQAVKPVPGQPELLAVWSDPAMGFDAPRKLAKLGGAGLALLIFCEVEAIEPGLTSPAERAALAAFIAMLQRENGSFFAGFASSLGGPTDRYPVPFYAGEASLGLLAHYEQTKDRQWLCAALAGLAHMRRAQLPLDVTPPDHWFLIAASRAHRFVERCPDTPVSRSQLLEHMRRICRDMIADQTAALSDSRIRGCYHRAGLTCGTATRLEGLLATLVALGHRAEARITPLEKSARLGTTFLVRSQLSKGPLAGGWTFVSPLMPPTAVEIDVAYRSQYAEVRVDYVAHALSALLQYHAWFQTHPR